jgi:hypothetical protein
MNQDYPLIMPDHPNTLFHQLGPNRHKLRLPQKLNLDHLISHSSIKFKLKPNSLPRSWGIFQKSRQKSSKRSNQTKQLQPSPEARESSKKAGEVSKKMKTGVGIPQLTRPLMHLCLTHCPTSLDTRFISKNVMSLLISNYKHHNHENQI